MFKRLLKLPHLKAKYLLGLLCVRMKEEKHNMYTVLCSVITLIAIIEAQFYVDYVSPAVPGQVDYTKHDLYSDGVRVQNTSFITFRVKCDGNANILLQRNRFDYKRVTAEIAIGAANNQGVAILENLSTKYTWCMNATGVVSALEYRYFWISWDNDTIRVGKGNTPHRHAFKCWEKISFNVQYISIGTSRNTRGYWKFDIAPTLPTQRTSSLTNEVSTTPSIDPRKEEEGKEGEEGCVVIAVYVAVPIAIIAIVLTTVIVWLVLRRKLKKRENDVSAAEYNEIDLTPRNRQLVRGMNNRAFDSRILEKQENANCSSDEILESNASLYTKLTFDEKRKTQPDRSVYTKITLDEKQQTGRDTTGSERN